MPKVKFSDITGLRFGRLEVLEPTSSHITSETKFVCRCDCGTVKAIVGRSLTKGFTTSCGCYRNERVAQTNSTHGGTSVRSEKWYREAYGVYKGMFSRCYDQRSTPYKNYGGRGIKVCDRWHDFENFVLDMYPKPNPDLTLERVDVNGDYCPDNCVWADRVEQANNKTTNVLITAFGRSMTGPQWSRETGVPYYTIRARLKRGWSAERAVSGEIVEAGQHAVTMISIGDKSRTIYEWSKISGIAAPTIRARMQKGEDAEVAVFRPLTPRNVKRT